LGAIAACVLSAALGATGVLPVALLVFGTAGAVLGRISAALAGVRRSSRDERYSLSIIRVANLLPLIGLSAMVIGLLPAVEHARETARRSQCKNKLRQHSGSHPECVYVDRNLEVVSVYSCPLCSAAGAPLAVAFVSEEDRQDAARRHLLPSPSAAFEIAQRLSRIHASPEFRRYREGPERVPRIWDEQGAVIQRGTAER
jgi:hypothetical protein